MSTFPVKDSDKKIRVFTTRIDTIYGANAVVMSAEHPLLAELLEGSALNQTSMPLRRKSGRNERPVAKSAKKRRKDSTRACSRSIRSAARPSVWVANYVLMEYGTGAVMSVPAHDDRDFEFAQKYSLPIKQVIAPVTHSSWTLSPMPTTAGDASAEIKHSFTDYGVLINRRLGRQTLRSRDARDGRTRQAKRFRRAAVTYRIRDWGVSRQRFWGAPVAILLRKGWHGAGALRSSPSILPQTAAFTERAIAVGGRAGVCKHNVSEVSGSRATRD